MHRYYAFVLFCAELKLMMHCQLCGNNEYMSYFILKFISKIQVIFKKII